MTRAWKAAVLFLAFAAGAGRVPAQSRAPSAVVAQPLVVLYLEGAASQRTDGAWTALSIGDELSPNASVKLEKLAMVQLRSAGSAVASITLTQPGTYALSTVLAASASLRSTGAVQAAAIGFSRVLSGTGSRMNAVGGVRSERMSGEDFGDLGNGEPADKDSTSLEAVKSARDLIAKADYAGAISLLRRALASASADEAPEVSFYLSSACELSGDVRAALAAEQMAVPRDGDQWAQDALLLSARLLEDSFAWTRARDLLVKAGAGLAEDDERAPVYFFLLALAYAGTGETRRQLAALDQVVALDPTGELGRTARQLRQAP